MAVRSFAQNFEDVLLWRALRHVPEGHYVDVGAAHPTYHSVTKLFYDAGWSGINVEPLPALARRLKADRPRDVTVHAAVSSQPAKTIELVVVDAWDELSTTSRTRADIMRQEGRSLSTVDVPVAGLDALLIEQGWSDVHFLKVDVEGTELDVLRTIDLETNRPWVILLEVIAGGTEAALRDDIREHLQSSGYVHAWFDGLNDFYVAKERADDLLPSFSVPVNITDDFVMASDSDDVVTKLIGEKLGLPGAAQSSEVVQRVEAVLRDRIEFESQLRRLQATHETLEVTLRSHEDELRRLRMKNEALEQSSFERERMVAWYAAELNNVRQRWNEHEARGHELQRIVDATETRLNEVLASTSWRTTLPIRALRRPRTYLRKLAGL